MTDRRRCYSELLLLPTLEERYKYLKIGGRVGETSFGFDRYLNQILYTSREWKCSGVRERVIVRDDGCELGISDYPIKGNIIIHHMNVVTMDDILERNPDLLNPEYLVCVSLRTHNAIHFGDPSQLPKPLVQRRSGDTCPWR